MSDLDNSNPYCLGALRCANTETYYLSKINKSQFSSFLEKSNSNDSGDIKSGRYHLTTDAFEDFKLGSYLSLEEVIFPNLVNNKKFFARKLETNFIDIGVPEDNLRFCNWINKGESYAL
jgi:NDP-sugar pyrophosphorylase family protein